MIRESTDIDVDTLMHRLRGEAEKYRSYRSVALEPERSVSYSRREDGISSSEVAGSDQAPPNDKIPAKITLHLPDDHERVETSKLPPFVDGKCELPELLELEDRDFVHAAYWAVLHREPDDGGINTYLSLLRGGKSKLEILEFLRHSPEGRSKSTSLPGLYAQLLLLRIGRLPVVGRPIRLLQALWCLPETQRRQRASHGYLNTLIERSGVDSRLTTRATYRGLGELCRGLNELTTYSASRASIDALNRKASSEEVWRWLDEVHSSLQALQSSKASMSEMTAIKATLNTASAALNSLESSKANLAAVQAAHEDISRKLQSMADRDEMAELISNVARQSAQATALLAASKADRSALDEWRESSLNALRAKIDRHELTTFTNYFVELLQARATTAQIGALESSLDAFRGRTESDRVAVAASLDQLSESISAIRDQIRLQAERAKDAARDTVSSVTQLESAHDALETSHSDLASRTDAAIGELKQILTKMSARSLDRSTFEGALEESRRLMRSTLAESMQSMHKTLKSLRHSMATVSASKADRTAFEVTRAETRSSIEALRAENKANHEASSAGVRETSHALACSTADLRALESAHAGTTLLTERTVDELSQALAALAQNKADCHALATAVDDTRALLDAARRETRETVRNALAPLTSQGQEVKRNLLEQERRLTLLLDEARRRLPKPISTRQIKAMLTEDDHLLDSMYASFEDKFRGTREEIKRRQSIYLPDVQNAKAGLPAAPVVDIGCGRGEWLELLAEAGLLARGVDLNRVFLQRCRELSLDVIERDGVAYLREQSPNSLGAITSFHLIEHLPLKTLIALLDASLRVLRPGGLVIFETPNPRNLQVGSCNFYLDPTHRNPLPPDLMRYLLEARGFVQVEVRELHPCEENRITDGARSVTEALNRFLFSAQDYAVIGKKC